MYGETYITPARNRSWMCRMPAVTVLFVVEAERPVGILHIHDLLRAGGM